MIKATIDINVILDFLNKREDHARAVAILDLCAENIVQGYVCAHKITTLSYFLLRTHRNAEKVKYVLHELLDLFHIIPTTEHILRDALTSKIKDYEDAVIEVSSFKNGIDYIVTGNLSDFKHSRIRSMSPAEFLALVTI